MKNILTSLSSFKIKNDKLDVGKSISVPVDSSKISDLVRNVVVRKDVYNAKIKNVQDEIPDITNTTLNAKMNEVRGEMLSITNLAATAALNAKINEVKGKILSITNLATTTTLTAVENKIPNVSNLV